MKLLKSLTAAFDAHKSTDKDLFDSWAEEGELEWNGSVYSTHGEEDTLILWDEHYTGVLSFENFTGETDPLFLTLMTWVNENGGDRTELGPPSFDVERVGVNTFDVDIKIALKEQVFGMKKDGKYTVIENPEIAIAEEVGKVEIEICCSDDGHSLEE